MAEHQAISSTSVNTLVIGEITLHAHQPSNFDHLLDRAARETPNDIDRIPYYATLWPSALQLMEILWQRRRIIENKRLLELGCGLALPAILAAKLGAKAMATDFHPDAAGCCCHNAMKNNADVEFQLLDWSNPPAWEPFQVVIGSDLLYEERHIPALVATITQLCAQDGVVFIADPGRNGLGFFTGQMQEKGWSCELHPSDSIFVMEFSRKNKAR